jgi:hypothetical protein
MSRGLLKLERPEFGLAIPLESQFKGDPFEHEVWSHGMDRPSAFKGPLTFSAVPGAQSQP